MTESIIAFKIEKEAKCMRVIACSK